MKRVLCIFLAILILVISVVVPYRETHAFVITAGTISAIALSGLASVLISAGLQFASDSTMQATVYDFLLRTPERVIDNLTFVSEGIQGITTELWDLATNYVNSIFNQGINNNESNVIPWRGHFATNVNMLPMPIPHSFLTGSPLQHGTQIGWSIDGVFTSTLSSEGQDSGGTGITRWRAFNSADPLMLTRFFIRLPNGVIPQLWFSLPTTPGINMIVGQFGNTGNRVESLGVTPNRRLNVTGTNLVDNLTMQSKPSLINVPATTNQLVNQTREQVIIIPYPNQWTGRFADVITQGQTWEKTGFDETTIGTWSGTWGTTLTGQRTFTGTLTVAGVTTNVSARTITIPVTQVGEIGRWRTISDLFTTRFPFSLPWDLVRAFSTMQVARQAPRWTITFPPNIFIGGGNVIIDFIQFDTWAVIIRWGVLILFNIGLILVTRKIIGAGG